MNSLNEKAKFQIGQFKRLKLIFCKFVDLEYQGQGQQFFELVRDLYVIIISFEFEFQIQKDSKVIAFTRNHTHANDDNADDDGTKNNMSPPGRGGGDIILWW